MISDVAIRDGEVVARDGDARDVPWWSFTKTVLATAALTLVRDGCLALDDPLPDRPYTLRQLLQHRAGLTDYGRLPAYHEAVELNDDAWHPDVMLEYAKADALLYEPGTGWAYSNIGYFHVRRLIEWTTRRPLADALGELVLAPLEIDGVRFAERREDLSPDYDPCWVYHGLLLGPLEQAALLLQRLLTGALLPPDLLTAMLDRYSVGGPIAGRPWKAPAYGLGLMIGETTSGATIAGHTGGGPGSVVAVYHRLDRPSGTVAAFAAGAREAIVEGTCVTLLEPRT